MPAKQVGDKYPDRDMPLDSEALKRLVEEVENHEVLPSFGYNRTYNRHNR